MAETFGVRATEASNRESQPASNDIWTRLAVSQAGLKAICRDFHELCSAAD